MAEELTPDAIEHFRRHCLLGGRVPDDERFDMLCDLALSALKPNEPSRAMEVLRELVKIDDMKNRIEGADGYTPYPNGDELSAAFVYVRTSEGAAWQSARDLLQTKPE